MLVFVIVYWSILLQYLFYINKYLVSFSFNYDFLLVFIAKAFIFSSVNLKEVLTLEYLLSKIRSVVTKRVL